MTRQSRRSLFILVAIVFTLAIGTAGFVLIDHYSPFGAFYMTLTTMTTVGYGELHPLSTAGRGRHDPNHHRMGIRGRHRQAAEQTHDRQTQRSLHHLRLWARGTRRGRGAGSLRRPFRNRRYRLERCERAIVAGHLAVPADSTRDDTLREVGIERARGLVAALSSDADNLFVPLSAKGLNPRIYVATRAAEEGAEEKMRRAGADAVFAPYSITGRRLAQSLLRPHVVQFLDFTTANNLGEDIAIERVPVAPSSRMVSKTIREMQIGREFGVIVMAIRNRDGTMVFNPSAGTPVRGGDHPIMMGREDSLRGLEQLLGSDRQHVIIGVPAIKTRRSCLSALSSSSSP